MKFLLQFGFSIFLNHYCFLFNFAEYSDVAAYRLSLSEDSKAINQLVQYLPVLL